MPVVRALLFDFDGLVADTESPSYQSWQEIFQEHGVDLDLTLWAECISNRESSFDPIAQLRALLGRDVDGARLEARRNRRKEELTIATDLMPGVRDLRDQARAAGLRVGIASGSSRGWVERHLRRLGFADGWEGLVSRDEVVRSKPHPDTYVVLLDRLGVVASEAMALEDSPNGIASAQAAGVYCVAVPNPLTSQLDLSRADARLETLEGVDLARLLAAAASR